MRKNFIFIMIILILVLITFTSCIKRDVKEERSNVIYGTGWSAYVTGGKVACIELQSNPTTGFDWYYDELPKGIEFVSKNYESSSKDKTAAGGGGIATFSFSVNESGTHVVQLTYKRNWENRPPSSVVKFSVSASKDSAGNLVIDGLSVDKE